MRDAEAQFSSFLERIRNPPSGANGANMVPVDGITNPPATNRTRARERRAAIAVRTAVTRLLNQKQQQQQQQQLGAAAARIPWGSTSLAPNAVALGRLFAHLARVVDGITPPKTPQTPQPTFEGLREGEGASSYADEVERAVEEEGGWTVEDEVFHFARGVEAYLSGIVGVGRDTDVVTPTEQPVLVGKEELRDAAVDLSDAERAAGFDAVAVRLLDGSLGIIRPSTAKIARSKVLSSYVSYLVYHLHRESKSALGARKRMLTEEADAEGRRNRERQRRAMQAEVKKEMMMTVEGGGSVAAAGGTAVRTGPIAAFATNRPLTTEDASNRGDWMDGATNVYRSTMLSAASHAAFAVQVAKMKDEFHRAGAEGGGGGGGGGVGTHLLLLDPIPTRRNRRRLPPARREEGRRRRARALRHEDAWAGAGRRSGRAAGRSGRNGRNVCVLRDV